MWLLFVLVFCLLWHFLWALSGIYSWPPPPALLASTVDNKPVSVTSVSYGKLLFERI